MRFVLPTLELSGDVLDFYREMEEHGDSCIGCGGWRDQTGWMRGMEDRHTGKNLPKGYVRENFYLCYEGGVLVGVFSLKFELTEFLLNFGGHIGYAVRPSRRGEGLATRMLGQGLALAREFGFQRVLCVCDQDNYPSERVIQKNGGYLEDERYDPEEQVAVKRYWIDL